MSALAPAALESNVLALRLRELAGEERNVQVDFLLHLDEFDRRRAFVEVGHASLWAYCLEALHLREGAAGRRIQAMRVLRRFPSLEAPLRDGRLCLSTVALLGQVLTEENVDDLLARAAFRTRAEVEQLVVSIQARTAPRAGLRKLAERAPAAGSAALQLPASDAGQAETATEPGTAKPTLEPGPAAGALPAPPPPVAQPKRKAETLAVSESHWSLRVTLDRACKEDLETLRSLLSHKVPDGDLAAVLHEAIRCAIEKHGQGRGRAGAEDEGSEAGRDDEGRRDEEDRGEAAGGEDHDPGDSAPRGVEARRRTLRLGRPGRLSLQQPLEARARPHPTRRPRGTVDDRQPPARLPSSQPASRREHLRARAHGLLSPRCERRADTAR